MGKHVVFCSKCGNEETSSKNFCSKCGIGLTVSSQVTSSSHQTRKSRWWYLVPIFFGILGGIVAYLLLQDDDKELAKKCLVLGIVVTCIMIAIYFLVFFMIGVMSYY
jgi:uncharacterized membrane protein YvbJ